MSRVTQEKLDELLAEIEVHVPGFEIVYKNEEGWYKSHWTAYVAWMFVNLVGLLAPSIKRRFNENYTTVFGGRIVAFTEPGDLRSFSRYSTLRHEYIHLRDHQKSPLWFTVSYLLCLPTILTMRAYWEIRGYTATLLCYYEVFGTIPDSVIERCSNQFTSPMYFFMFPFPTKIRKIFKEIRTKIYEGEISGLYTE